MTGILQTPPLVTRPASWSTVTLLGKLHLVWYLSKSSWSHTWPWNSATAREELLTFAAVGAGGNPYLCERTPGLTLSMQNNPQSSGNFPTAGSSSLSSSWATRGPVIAGSDSTLPTIFISGASDAGT